MNARIKNVMQEMPDMRQGHAGAGARFRRSRRVALVAALGLCATLLPVTATYADGPNDDHSRPMGGRCTTTFAFTTATTARIEGRCQLRHLGQTTLEAVQSVTARDDGTLFVTNASVYTAANGDRLFANFLGVGVVVSPGLVAFSGTETFRRGTGRFDDAIGSVALSGTAQFTSTAAGQGEYKTLGTISY